MFVVETLRNLEETQIEVEYDGYVDLCYRMGDCHLRDLIDNFRRSEGEYDEWLNLSDIISYRCEIINRGIRSAVGHRLRSLRVRKGISLRALATMIGISPSNLSNIEKGNYTVGLEILHKISSALDVEVVIL